MLSPAYGSRSGGGNRNTTHRKLSHLLELDLKHNPNKNHLEIKHGFENNPLKAGGCIEINIFYICHSTCLFHTKMWLAFRAYFK